MSFARPALERVELACGNRRGCPPPVATGTAKVHAIGQRQPRWWGRGFEHPDGSFEVLERSDCPLCGEPGRVL